MAANDHVFERDEETGWCSTCQRPEVQHKYRPVSTKDRAAKLARRARLVATDLAGIVSREVKPELSFGCALPTELVEALAKELGAETRSSIFRPNYGGRPGVIVAFTAEIGGVKVSGQGERPMTAADLQQEAQVSP